MTESEWGLIEDTVNRLRAENERLRAILTETADVCDWYQSLMNYLYQDHPVVITSAPDANALIYLAAEVVGIGTRARQALAADPPSPRE